MPERVDFYLVESTDQISLLTCACRIAGKAFQQGLRVYIQLDDGEAVKTLDQLLWSFSPTSFVPHDIAGSDQANDAPVVIGNGSGPAGYEQLLVSLTREIPADVERYHRVADLISSEPQNKQLGRERYKQYRAAGVEPITHEISI